MAVTLNATVSDRYANSYVTVDYADEYWDSHYSTTKAEQWSNLDTGQKALLLIRACRIIETARFTLASESLDESRPHLDRASGAVLFLNDREIPVKYSRLQSLQFPRSMDRDVETGALFIPEPVKMAQCEQALYSLNFDETAIANRLQGIGEDTTTIGSIRLHQRFTQGGSEWSPSALEYVKPFFLKLSQQVKRA